MTKREMAEEIVDILAELGIIKIVDAPKKRPKPSAMLPKDHSDSSCILETVQKQKAP